LKKLLNFVEKRFFIMQDNNVYLDLRWRLLHNFQPDYNIKKSAGIRRPLGKLFSNMILLTSYENHQTLEA